MPFKSIVERNRYQREYRKKNYHKNKDKYKTSTDKWRANNPEKVRLWSKNSYYRNYSYYFNYRIANYEKNRRLVLKNKDKYNFNARQRYSHNIEVERMKALIYKHYKVYLQNKIILENKKQVKDFINDLKFSENDMFSSFHFLS